jgi:hypothetical protein
VGLVEGVRMKRSIFTTAEVFVLIIVIILVVGWVKNIIKLAQCDFEAPYKCEVVHSLGVIPIAGAVTGWIDVGR